MIVVILVVQIPFIYRRYKTGERAAQIRQIQSQRLVNTDQNFREYKGVIHVHTSLGGHSTGGFDELISAANVNGLDFVLMTEHSSDDYDTAALTLNGNYGKTLFIGGNEVETAVGDRFLTLPGSADSMGTHKVPTAAFIDKLHSAGQIALVTYPEKLKTRDAKFDGIEVFSLNTAARKINPLIAPLDLLWSGSAYPDLTFLQMLSRPDENLKQYDGLAKTRPISMFIGIDAHSNIGFHILGDDAGHKWINFKIDPYEYLFRIARLHIRLGPDEKLSRESVVEAIRKGHFFNGLDTLGDSTGFLYSTIGSPITANEGDEVPFTSELKLSVRSPVQVRFVLFKDGSEFASGTGIEFEFKPDGPGEYRVEAYQDALGSPFDRLPWVMTNPIYVR